MKIKRFDLRKMRNEEWFNFFTEFKRFVDAVSPDALNIAELYAVFLALYDDADVALEMLRKSFLSDAIIVLDGERDSAYHGLSLAVESAASHFDPAKQQAADRLLLLWKHYGNLAKKPYNEETAGIINIVQELRGPFAQQVATLELIEWVNELERRNNAFEDAIIERNRETAAKPDLHVLDLRRKMNRCYLDMLQRIEAQALLQSNTTVETFIRTLNANIERYMAAVQHHHAKKKTDVETKETV